MNEKIINNQTMEYISDWRNRLAAHQKQNMILTAVAFVIAIILCTFSFFVYQNKNYNRIVNQNMKYVQDTALQEANQIEKELHGAVVQVGNFAKQYATRFQDGDEELIKETLSALSDKTLFDRIAFIAPDGKDTSLEGVSFVADRDYFKNAMNGQSGYEFIEQSRVTGGATIIFYAPIYEGRDIVGVMAGFYEQEKIEKIFSYQVFNYNPRTYLLKGDGAIISDSEGTAEKGNYLEKLSKKNFVGETDYQVIQGVINSDERTSITFSFTDNRDTSVGVIAQFANSDWMILSILPHDVTAGMLENANRAGRVLMVQIVVVLFSLIVILFVISRVQSRRLKAEVFLATENLKKSVLHDKKQSFIIESLGNTYSSIYYVNILNGNYERISEREKTVIDIPETGSWDEGYGGYVDRFVDEPYKEDMRKFLDLESFRKPYEEDEKLTVEYQRADKGWRSAVMLPVEYDKDKIVTSVIYAVQKIEAEKKRELETKQALQEAYEAAQLASQAKTTFLSNMSHDIRTPMNAIVGMTAIAASNLDNTEKVSDCLKKITASSKHLLGMINKVLDMSKIESGKVDLNEEEFSLSELMDNLISLHQPLLREKNHTLIVKVNQLTHENVVGDSTRLQQVFSNLLSNAIKYTPDNGKIEVSISEKTTNKSSVGWYEVVFKDNGIGMTKEFKESVFEPFNRAKDQRVEEIQGTGLGMSIARNIVRMMNGDIRVESEINKGSTFIVSFSLKIQEEKEVSCEAFVDLPILVVDDDETACESTCLILDSLSMNSEYVLSGREAVDKTVERHENNDDYYAVIVDWKMPDMNGIETTREIRRRIGDDIPIIIISAYDWTDIEQEAKAAGVSAFLSKPLFKSRVVNLFQELTGSEVKAETTDTAHDIREQDFAGKRILLAEDNEINREIAVEILSMMNLEVEIAENGKVCVDKFEGSKPGYYDLIFMDIQMPVMDGYEAARQIRRSEHPDAKTLPIVAMTANAFSTDVRAAFESGMNGHVSKPIDIGNIIKALTENLKE